MTNETDIPPSVAEQAAQWWVLFHDEGATAADHREFGQWVARGPDRVEAYLRVARVQKALGKPGIQWPATSAEVLVREAKAAAPEPASLRPERRSAPAHTTGRSNRTFGMRLAAGLAAAVMVAIGALWVISERPQQYHTLFGEQRSILLEDGSRATLNSSSRIEVRFAGNRRHILLLEGEALFEVAHNAARPFDVQTDHALLRAVGTRFDVDRRPNRTIVTVVEGRVAMLSHAEQPEKEAVRMLGAADQLVIAGNGPHETLHGVNVVAATSWTERRLVFEHRPLGEVAEELNRYNVAQIEIRSEKLRSQRITGVFRSDDAGSFLSFVASIPGVRVVDDGHGGHVVTLDSGAVSE